MSDVNCCDDIKSLKVAKCRARIKFLILCGALDAIKGGFLRCVSLAVIKFRQISLEFSKSSFHSAAGHR